MEEEEPEDQEEQRLTGREEGSGVHGVCRCVGGGANRTGALKAVKWLTGSGLFVLTPDLTTFIQRPDTSEMKKKSLTFYHQDKSNIHRLHYRERKETL
ncbi:uncharacterized protein V6R79_020349 [Siganus canaliculatus]